MIFILIHMFVTILGTFALAVVCTRSYWIKNGRTPFPKAFFPVPLLWGLMGIIFNLHNLVFASQARIPLWTYLGSLIALGFGVIAGMFLGNRACRTT